MSKYLAIALALAAVGCGSGSGSSSIYGDWLRSSNGLVVGVTFETDGTYSARTMQVVSRTAVNQQLETGSAAFEPGAFTLTPDKWSCAERSEPSHFEYSIDDGTLYIAGTPYTRNDAAPDAGTVVTVGCFAEDGTFTARALSGDEP
jgi:hypothetical protein